MNKYVKIADVENYIISAIESTDLDYNNKMGEQSDVWNKIYEALKDLNKLSLTLNQIRIISK